MKLTTLIAAVSLIAGSAPAEELPSDDEYYAEALASVAIAEKYCHLKFNRSRRAVLEARIKSQMTSNRPDSMVTYAFEYMEEELLELTVRDLIEACHALEFQFRKVTILDTLE